MIAIQKILVPTDFSEYSQHAVKYAVALAERFEAKLYIVHIWEQAIVATPTETFQAEIWVEAEAAEKEMLDRLAEELRNQGVDAEPVFGSGSAHSQIVKTAKELDVDLITLATHGRTGLRHLMFGSTAEKIVRLAPCPVLVVKHPEHEFIKELE
jgi:nucleotide-binding universal stress UspA family protein